LYIDEDAMDGDLVRGLRSRGIDVVTAAEAGDFHEIHTTWTAPGRDHAGIILAQQQRYSTGEQIRRLVRLIASLTNEGMRNREEFLGRW
jgi:hypothetical protein